MTRQRESQTPLALGELFERARALDRCGLDRDATQAYLDVLARDMNHAAALNYLGALLSKQGYRGAARVVYQQAIDRHPADPVSYVNLANLLRTEDAPDAARAHYETALRMAPLLPEAHQGMSYLMMEQGDEQAAERHRDLGFSGRALTTAPFRGEDRAVTVLQLLSCRGGNIPTQHLLSDRMFLTHSLVAEYAGSTPLPAYDVVVNAIGDADLCQAGLVDAEALLTANRAPVINRPGAVIATGRLANAARLGRLQGVVAPRMALLSRAALQGRNLPETLTRLGIHFPVLLRAPGFHTGQHFKKLDRLDDLPKVLAELLGDPLMAIQYLDAQGKDGLTRKYRVMMIDGCLYPLHLAISDSWKVHYYTASMVDRPDLRAEEEEFLTDMPRVLGPTAMRALLQISDTLALDYAGIDFALAPDGRLLLFEANATMIVASPPAGAIWDYRRRSVNRILDAVRSLILSRAHGAAVGRRCHADPGGKGYAE